MAKWTMQKIVKYKKLIITLIILSTLFVTSFYVYQKIYKPFYKIIDIYLLKSDAKFTEIKTKSLDQVYDTIKDKIEGDGEVLIIIISPF